MQSSVNIVEIKSSKEAEVIKECGELASRVLVHLKQLLAVGISTFELDIEARYEIKKLGAAPAFLGYRGYPAVLCVSKNCELVHGVPSRRKKISAGDIVSLDIGIKYRGFFGDVAATYPVGNISDAAEKLIRAGPEVFEKILLASRPGRRMGDLSWSIQKYAQEKSFSVVRDYVGHGIGRELHEDPVVPNYGEPGCGVRISKGMVLAVEPMICEGGFELEVDNTDGWTVRTKDRKLCVHFEHMIFVDDKPKVLTFWD